MAAAAVKQSFQPCPLIDELRALLQIIGAVAIKVVLRVDLAAAQKGMGEPVTVKAHALFHQAGVLHQLLDEQDKQRDHPRRIAHAAREEDHRQRRERARV